jgi:hypothetical protein
MEPMSSESTSILDTKQNCIHYKFKNGKEFSVISLDGPTITLEELKRTIIEEKKLAKGNVEFDLEISNFETCEVYPDNSVVAGKSSVIIRRVPKKNLDSDPVESVIEAKPKFILKVVKTEPPEIPRQPQQQQQQQQNSFVLDKVDIKPSLVKTPVKPSVAYPHLFTQKPTPVAVATPTIQIPIPKPTTAVAPVNQTPKPIITLPIILTPKPNIMPPENDIDAEEQFQISQALNKVGEWASTVSYIDGAEQHRGNKEKPMYAPRSVPVGYICHRCGKPGHYISLCPTNGDPEFNNRHIKRGGVGIPLSFLTPITAEEAEANPGALVMPDGAYYVAAPMSNVFEREIGRKQSQMANENKVPENLRCLLCSKLISEAVLMPCCASNFCESCIFSDGFMDEDVSCPVCKRTNPTRLLMPNQILRDDVNNYLSIQARESEKSSVNKIASSNGFVDNDRGFPSTSDQQREDNQYLDHQKDYDYNYRPQKQFEQNDNRNMQRNQKQGPYNDFNRQQQSQQLQQILVYDNDSQPAFQQKK